MRSIIEAAMFSGIVETTSRILETRQSGPLVSVYLEKPSNFNDLKIGDSIAVDGVCLTLEAFDECRMAFTLGPETLSITGWTADGVQGRAMNVERSLRFGDRIHGHLVTGHVDARAHVLKAEPQGDSLTLTISIPQILRPLIWRKGSVAINGVSLTVNSVTDEGFTVGLIPETLRRTNLNQLTSGSTVLLEADNSARGLLRILETRREIQA